MSESSIRKESSSWHRWIRSNGTAAIINQAVRASVLGLWILLLARFLTPAELGAYVAIYSLAKVFGVVSSLGLDRILVRHFLDDADCIHPVLVRGWWIKCGASILAYFALLLATSWLFPNDKTSLILAALIGSSILAQALEIIDFYFQSSEAMWLVFWGRSVPLLLVFGLKILCLFLYPTLIAVAFMEVVEAIAVCGALIYVFWRNKPARHVRTQPVPTTLILFKEGIPLLVASIAVILYMKADIIILGKMAGTLQTGLYSAAAQLSEVWAFIPLAFAIVIFPKIGRWRSQNCLWRNYELIMRAAFFLAILIAGFLTLFAPMIVVLIFGEAYQDAAGLLRIYSWSGVFIFWGIAQGGFDIFQKITWLTTWRTIIGLAINLGLNFLWIPLYGAKGAAWATLLSYGCSAFLLNVAHPATRPVFFMQLRAIFFWNLGGMVTRLKGANRGEL